MKYLYLLILFFLLSSCSSSKAEYSDLKTTSKEQSHTQKLDNTVAPPSWYTDTTYSNSADYLYGYGSSKNTKGAINNALADISSNLETTISTQGKLNINANNKSLDKQISENISTSSRKVMFLGYKIINQKHLNGITYVLVSINVPILINSLKQAIIKKQNSQKVNEPRSDLDTLEFTQRLYSNTLYIKNAINTLELIDRNSDLSMYNQIYDKQLHTLNNISKRIKIYFDDSNYPNFLYPPLKEFLQKIFITTNNKSNANILIKITNNKFDESTDKLGNYIINTSIKVTIQEPNTNKIITKNFDVQASSGYGRYETILKLKQNFADELVQSHNFLDQTSL